MIGLHRAVECETDLRSNYIGKPERKQVIEDLRNTAEAEKQDTKFALFFFFEWRMWDSEAQKGSYAVPCCLLCRAWGSLFRQKKGD